MTEKAATVRTRFAPSPTGYLHIGGARTALFNYLFARSHGGKFVLRIEDTDKVRSTPESIQAIFDGMQWLGLHHDEGPFYQTDRYDMYKEHALGLLEKGLAYRCWCKPEELQERREAALKAGRPPQYDKRCKVVTDAADTDSDAPFAVRFSVPDGTTKFSDLIKGDISFNNTEIEDLVILRSDGSPTYNLCVVLDDATMHITHVIRGDDHITNTPKQILLYQALGFSVPEFAHLPMILGPDGKRLSKRHGAASVTAYRDEGYLSHALVNYLVRLGWSHGDQEIFSMDELVEFFTLDSVGKSSGALNPEKLLWLNQHYIKQATDEELGAMLLPFFQSRGINNATNDTRLPLIAGSLRDRGKTLKDMAEAALFYFQEKVEYTPKALKKFLTPDKAELFNLLIQRLGALETFCAGDIQSAFEAIMEERELGLGKLAQPVRVALTGTTVSPGIFETIEAMGKDMTLTRLRQAVETIQALPVAEESAL